MEEKIFFAKEKGLTLTAKSVKVSVVIRKERGLMKRHTAMYAYYYRCCGSGSLACS